MATEQKKVLEAKRRHEDMILSMQHTLADSANVQRKSLFEIKTTGKIERRQKAVSSI
tara:strand:+ start:471 stop:641 length:171 start_codon:yes stop_codon:yes gene_type:complete